MGYIPHNAILVFGTQQAVDGVASSGRIQWLSPYHPAFKAYSTDRPLHGDTPALFVVQLASVPGHESVQELIAARGTAIVRRAAYLAYENLTVIDPDANLLDDLRANPYVVAIQPWNPSLPSGERESIAVTQLQASAFEPWEDGVRPYKPAGNYSTWLQNRGLASTPTYRIAFADGGLDPNRSDLNRPGTVWQTYVGGTAYDTQGHGTAVASMAVGNPQTGLDPRGFLWGLGIAPTASIYVQKILGGTPSGNELTWANDAHYWGATVQTHSHNFYNAPSSTGPGLGRYTLEDQIYDLAVRDTYGDEPLTPMPVTISAGNICGGAPHPGAGDCTYRVLSPALAKNVLTVGASESWRPRSLPDPTYTTCDPDLGFSRQNGDFLAESFRNVAYVSRRGTEDGRFKPEIVAPGTLVSAATAGDNKFCINPAGTGYIIDTGTSFSSPQAAAAYVLLTAKRGMTMSPAMLKAAVIGGTRSLKGGTDRYSGSTIAARPNAVQGFGRLYLGDLLANSGVVNTYLDESAWQPFTSAGQTRSRWFTVADSTKPDVIVLAWTDEPAIVSANPALVRDLDLEIWHSVLCHRYTGNQMLSTEYSRLQGGVYCNAFTYDRRNNVEMVVIPPNTLTGFDLDVYAMSWGFGSRDQRFAVFASNAY